MTPPARPPVRRGAAPACYWLQGWRKNRATSGAHSQQLGLMASPEAIAKAVAAVAAAFSTQGTEPAILVSASTSVLRLLTEGEELGLDVDALARGVVDGGLMRQMVDVLQDPSRVEAASPELVVELRAVLVLALSEVFTRLPAAAATAGQGAVDMVAVNLEDARAANAQAKAAAAAAAIIDGTPAQVAPGADRHPHTVPTSVTGVTDAAGELTQELRAHLEGLVSDHQVVLFMKGVPDAPRCGFSKATVEMLRDKQVAFGSVDVLADDRVREGMKLFSEWPTFPQLYAGGELLGGLDILKELDAAGELMDSLAATTAPQPKL
jgi:Grx4 family monothiol glutaredoxin